MAELVDTVLFDIDDTLCEYRRSGAELLALAFDREGIEPFFEVDEYYAQYDTFIETTDSVEVLRAECFAGIAEEHGRDPELGRAVASAYATERNHRNVRPLPGSREAVTSLSHDHRLGVVTNGPPDTQAKKLDEIGVADAFEVVIHAGYDAPAKPDPEPFHRALSALDATPDSTVHVGNSLASDVAGAQAAGLKAVWLSNGTDLCVDSDCVPEYTLDSLSDLTEHPWNPSVE
ncbi:HAD family hydrolase [Halocatena marina]|uniref:HAD family hydrolase n=1 Tax=Halocatena marina TaxID=2934937 RepID=UPI00200C795E|nr:HAD family hydrolase [Halocatena marina]